MIHSNLKLAIQKSIVFFIKTSKLSDKNLIKIPGLFMLIFIVKYRFVCIIVYSKNIIVFCLQFVEFKIRFLFFKFM
jgi:hypothetical protein